MLGPTGTSAGSGMQQFVLGSCDIDSRAAVLHSALSVSWEPATPGFASGEYHPLQVRTMTSGVIITCLRSQGKVHTGLNLCLSSEFPLSALSHIVPVCPLLSMPPFPPIHFPLPSSDVS